MFLQLTWHLREIFGAFDLLLHLKPAARLISHEALVMWTNNKTTTWLNSLSPEDKEKCMADARANTGAILARYKERKEKIFQLEVLELNSFQETEPFFVGLRINVSAIFADLTPVSQYGIFIRSDR